MQGKIGFGEYVGDYFRGKIVRNAILNGKTVRMIFMHSK